MVVVVASTCLYGGGEGRLEQAWMQVLWLGKWESVVSVAGAATAKSVVGTGETASYSTLKQFNAVAQLAGAETRLVSRRVGWGYVLHSWKKSEEKHRDEHDSTACRAPSLF